MTSKNEKRRSFIRATSGSPIIPINSTFHSNFNINQQLASSRKSLDNNDINLVQHHPDFVAHIKTSSLIKLLLIGDAGVGKSALILNYCDDIFDEKNIKTTIGVDLKVKVVNVDGSYFKTVIWDTAGQERYRNVIPSLYKGTNGVLLTYDVTDRESFKGLYHWIQECFDNCDLERTIFYIVGNKLDQDGKVINSEDIKKLLNFVKKNYPNFKISAVFEVSAKFNTLVYGLFDRIIKDLVENRCYFDEKRLRNKKSIDLSIARDELQQRSNCCF